MAVDARLSRRRAGPRRVLRSALCAVLLAGTPAVFAESLLAERAEGDCALRLESHAEWRTVRVRVHAAIGERCSADLDAVTALLEEGLARAGSRFDAIAFGRMIDYPWLGNTLRDLAANDPGWDASRGRPVVGEVNAYVAGLVDASTMFEPLRVVLARHGYVARGVSLEKVLVATDGLPFDAQLWLRLAPH